MIRSASGFTGKQENRKNYCFLVSTIKACAIKTIFYLKLKTVSTTNMVEAMGKYGLPKKHYTKIRSSVLHRHIKFHLNRKPESGSDLTSELGQMKVNKSL